MEQKQQSSISEEQIWEKIEEMGGFEELAQKEEFFKCERAWWELTASALGSIKDPSQEVKTAFEVCMAVLEFSKGNLGYQPKDFTARILSKNIHRVIKASLEARVKQKAKNALAGKASAEKRKNTSAEESQYKPAQEYIPLQESAREDTSQHVLPQEYTPQQESARANHTTITEQNRTEQNRTEPFVGSSSKDSKGMGEEEKSPYFVQQSQQAAGQSQFSLATPQQSQPVEETQQPSLATPQPAAPWDNPQRVAPQVKFPVSPQPSLATPQQQAATQTKFSVGQQSQLSLYVHPTIQLIEQSDCYTYKRAFATIKEHGGNQDVQKTIAALYFLTNASQPEVLEITGLMDEVVNKGVRNGEDIHKEVFNMAVEASDGCNFVDRNVCRAATDRVKNYLKGLLTKPQSSTSPYIDPSNPF